MIFEYLKGWFSGIQKNYGVNPLIFVIIYFAGAPFFWFSIYKIIEGLRKKKLLQVRTFGLILGLTTIAPFVYVALFGHNVPLWFWIFAGVIVLYTAFSVFKKTKQ
uniref:Uncharacterized protein n=1 Tax=candidate division WOR-3 bacterium TaxID=2052148 RepID=A0A7C4XNJ4_UNCW3